VAATAFETAWRQEAEALAIDLAVVAPYLRAATDALVEADAGSIVRVEVGVRLRGPLGVDREHAVSRVPGLP
jgi:hypothetical protein